MDILKQLKKGKKQLAILIDPDKYSFKQLENICLIDSGKYIDYYFIGGSIVFNSIEPFIDIIRAKSNTPIVLFPGNVLQISPKADAILLLSLLSGRNPEFLIGNHVTAAPVLHNSGLEIIPTAYLLIYGGKQTSVEYISNTKPIPEDKTDIALATALAGEMLGMRLLYLETGSGANKHIPAEMIQTIRKKIKIPIIVGGGIRTPENMRLIYQNGADLIVLGSIIEEYPKQLTNFALIKNEFLKQ